MRSNEGCGEMASYGHVYQFSPCIEIESTKELIVICGPLTGAIRIIKTATITTEAKTCVKMIASQKSRVYLLVNKLVSIVSLINFTK